MAIARLGSIRQWRRRRLVKAIAIWFVVLIVLPFTAPFRTLDPRSPVDKASTQDAKVADKLAKDAGVPIAAPSAAPSFTALAAPGAPGLAPGFVPPGVLTPLRI